MSSLPAESKASYILDKLQSLSGVVPIGAFLLEHLWSNSYALVSVSSYNEVSHSLQAIPWRVVGPVCESSDDFGEHLLPHDPPGQVAILDAGAYGYTMASQYNGRQLPAEVFVREGRVVGRTDSGSVESWVQARARAGI